MPKPSDEQLKAFPVWLRPYVKEIDPWGYGHEDVATLEIPVSLKIMQISWEAGPTENWFVPPQPHKPTPATVQVAYRKAPKGWEFYDDIEDINIVLKNKKYHPHMGCYELENDGENLDMKSEEDFERVRKRFETLFGGINLGSLAIPIHNWPTEFKRALPKPIRRALESANEMRGAKEREKVFDLMRKHGNAWLINYPGVRELTIRKEDTVWQR